MSYSISLMINYINNNSISYYEDLIKNIASNIPNSSIYNDYELSGTNKYIKNNTSSSIIEIDGNIDDNIEENNINSIINIIELILQIKEITIEYIYNNNNILYCSKKYLNNLNKNLHNKKEIMEKIEKNKKNENYDKLYKALKIYKLLK